MDGRWKLALAGPLFLSGLIGCTTSKPSLPEAPPPMPTGKNSVYVPEPTDDGERKDGPLSCSTLVLFAGAWVDAVAKDPNKPAGEREALLARANRAYQDVLQREPKNVDAWIGIGHMYQVSGEAQKLREIEQKLVSTFPQDARVWAWVAKHQAQAKNWDAAIESFNRASKLDPDNRTYRISLGFTLAKGGRYADGYECLTRSMREADARYNMAQAMLHNGDTDKARNELHLCLRADPSMKVAEEQLAHLADGPPGHLPPLR